MRYIILVVIMVIMTGCGNVPKKLWDHAENLCSVNGGLLEISQNFNEWYIYCGNGARFQLSNSAFLELEGKK